MKAAILTSPRDVSRHPLRISDMRTCLGLSPFFERPFYQFAVQSTDDRSDHNAREKCVSSLNPQQICWHSSQTRSRQTGRRDCNPKKGRRDDPLPCAFSPTPSDQPGHTIGKQKAGCRAEQVGSPPNDDLLHVGLAQTRRLHPARAQEVL